MFNPGSRAASSSDMATAAATNAGPPTTVSELYDYSDDQVDRAARRASGRQRPFMERESKARCPG